MKRLLIICLFLIFPALAGATVQDPTFTASFSCTGSTGPYPFIFPISDPTALTVTEAGTVLASAAYTVTPVNNNYANGGSVTLVSACPSGSTLVLKRNTPIIQSTVFTDNMPIPYKTFERGLDKLTEIDQEIQGQVSSITTDGACFPGSTCQMAGTIPTTAIGFSTSPSFNATLDTSYSMTLSGNVTSSTITGTPLNGNLLSLTLTENVTGGYTFAFPANFVFTPTFVFQTAANAINELTFKYDGTNWHLISNGGGSGGSTLPGGNANDLQKNSGSNTFVAAGINDNGTAITVSENTKFKGPNPYTDVTAFGARATATPPSGVNCTTTNGSKNVTLSSASTYINGDGIVCYGAGASNSVSTPSAPTVTNVLANGGTGTGLVTPSAVGSNTVCYKVAAMDVGGGYSPASTETCTTTGQTLGLNTVSITSLSRSGVVVTVNTSSAHTFLVGCTTCGEVLIPATGLSDVSFAGWHSVTSATDSTHFTFYNTTQSTVNGAAPSATGGTAKMWAANHLAITPVANTWLYLIYAGASNAETLYGISRPQGTTTTDPTFDDFGSTMMGNTPFPPWVPTTPPSVAANDQLDTTIASGAGTTSIVTADAAGASVTGGSNLDSCPAFKAAAIASNDISPIWIPSVPQGSYFKISSVCDLRAYTGLSWAQSGTIYLNPGTLLITGGRWNGTALSAAPGNGQYWGTYPNISSTQTVGLYISNFSNVSLKGVNFAGFGGNNQVLLFGDTPTGFSGELENLAFTTGTTTNDKMGIGLYLRGSAGQSIASLTMDKIYFAAGDANETSHNAGFFCNLCGDVHLKTGYAVHRGILFSSPSPGGELQIEQLHINGGGTPLVTVVGSTPVNVSLAVAGNGEAIMDTIAEPCVSFLGLGGNLSTSSCYPSSGVQIATGYVKTVTLNGSGNALTGSAFFNPSYGTESVSGSSTLSDTAYGTTKSVDSLNYWLVSNAAQAAPTCSVSSGGSLTVATYIFRIVPQWWNGKEGLPSLPSTSCTTTSGNQTITINWTAGAGTPQSYYVYASVNGGGFGAWNGISPNPASSSTTSATWSTNGSALRVLGGIWLGGPTTIGATGISTTQVILPAVTAPTGQAGATYQYTDSTALWPSFKPNGNTAYVFPGFLASTVWAAGQCATLSSTTWALVPQVCGTPAFSGLTTGVNTTATMTLGSGATLTYSGTGVVNARQVIGIDFNAASGCGATTYLRGDGTCNTPAGAGNVSTTTGAQYGIPTWTNSTTLGNVAPGTSGYPLISQGASSYPVFGQLPLATGVTGQLPNANLANAATTVNGQTCTLGSTCTVPFQTNTNGGNTSQAGINLINSVTNSVGLTATFTNTATNQVKVEVGGSSYTGQAATAGALGALGTECGAGNAARGIDTSGNARDCFLPTGVALQTNGSPNSSQTTLNFITSTTNTDGLTVTPSNSTSTEKFEVTGTTLPVAGGTGVSSPTAHSIGIPEGSGNWTFITGTAGLCLLFNGVSADHSAATCPGNNFLGTQYGVPYALTTTTLGSLTPPTSNGLYSVVYNVTGGVALPPTVLQAGLAGRAIIGSASTDTVLYSDSLNVIDHDSAGSASVNETLPTATTLGNANFGYSYSNHSTHTDTITPTTWTINGSATLSVPASSFVRVKVDPNSSTNWLADVSASALAGVATFSGDGTLITNSSSVGGVTATLGNASAYNIWGRNAGTTGAPGYSALTCGFLPALTGDTTTSAGNCATTTGALNGTAFSGTSGHLVSFGASNTPADSTVVAANVTTAAAPGTSGDCAQFAGSNRTLSDAGFGCSGSTIALLAGTNTYTGASTFSKNAASSAPAFNVTGTTFSGTGTTATPLFLIGSGSAASSWNTAGTYLGFNTAGSYTGNIWDIHVNGGSSVAKLDYQGNITVASCTGCGSGTGTVTVVSSGNLTSTALVTGGGSQSLQTPNATSTLSAAGNMSLPGTLAVTGHVTLEGVTSTGAQGTGAIVFANTPTLTTPNIGAATGTSLAASGTLTSGTNGGTGGSLTLNGATSGNCAFTVSATGGTPSLCGTAVTPANIVVASSPGAGIGHFAGSTQTLTSSAVVDADVSFTAPSLGAATATTQSADNNSTTVATTAYVDRTVTRSLGWSFGDVATGSALTTSEVGYITVPFACTIKGWHIMADAGTTTVKVWRVNGGTALPTVSNSINTSGVSLSTGTKIDSTTLTDFTSTAIAANDTLGFSLFAVATAKQITFQLDCSQ